MVWYHDTSVVQDQQLLTRERELIDSTASIAHPLQPSSSADILSTSDTHQYAIVDTDRQYTEDSADNGDETMEEDQEGMTWSEDEQEDSDEDLEVEDEEDARRRWEQANGYPILAQDEEADDDEMQGIEVEDVEEAQTDEEDLEDEVEEEERQEKSSAYFAASRERIKRLRDENEQRWGLRMVLHSSYC